MHDNLDKESQQCEKMIKNYTARMIKGQRDYKNNAKFT